MTHKVRALIRDGFNKIRITNESRLVIRACQKQALIPEVRDTDGKTATIR